MKSDAEAESEDDATMKESESKDEAKKDDGDHFEDTIITNDYDGINNQQASSSSSTFLHQLVAQRTAFVQVKQELTDDLATAQQQQAAIDEAMADEDLCVVCMDRERSCLYVPCNHLAVCGECDAGIMAASQPCPMCNTEIDREGSVMGCLLYTSPSPRD